MPDKCGLYLIGIGGATCSGKTTIAEKVRHQLTQHGARVEVFHQDTYYRKEQDLDEVFIPSLNYWNFDSPKSVDFGRLVDDVRCCIASVRDSASDHDQTVIVIVEGNLIYECRSLDALFDDRFFIKTTYLFCKCIREDRNYVPSDAAGYFDNFVWPAYEKMVDAADSRQQDFVFLRSVNMQANIDTICAKTMGYVTDCWVELTNDHLSVDRATGFVSMPEWTTRNTSGDKTVLKLFYEAYESLAYKEIKRICEYVKIRWRSIGRMAVFHRLGKVGVEEISIVVAISAPHRKDSFESLAFTVDSIKHHVPLWKMEIYVDSDSRWIEGGAASACFADRSQNVRDNEAGPRVSLTAKP